MQPSCCLTLAIQFLIRSFGPRLDHHLVLCVEHNYQYLIADWFSFMLIDVAAVGTFTFFSLQSHRLSFFHNWLSCWSHLLVWRLVCYIRPMPQFVGTFHWVTRRSCIVVVEGFSQSLFLYLRVLMHGCLCVSWCLFISLPVGFSCLNEFVHSPK